MTSVRWNLRVVTFLLFSIPAAVVHGAEPIPLLVGNYPDPTIVRDGDDYYLTNTSLNFQPGLPIWHSKDLRTWKIISFATKNHGSSIWAPDLIKHGDRFYLYFPAGGTNWVVTADTPAGPWTEPIDLGVGHIDPGHIADDRGRRFLHLSGGNMVELSANGLEVLGKPRKVYDGWPIPRDWAIECFCLESPKLMRFGEFYYLTSAQGGTAGPATSHMAVVARSRSAEGPWENSPHNPMIRTTSAEDSWWSKGHGTIFQDADGQWYVVYHGYMKGFRSLGRCVLLEPVERTDDGWFRAAAEWPEGWQSTVRIDLPQSDDFEGEVLGPQWQAFAHWDDDRFDLGGGVLSLRGEGESLDNSSPLTVMARGKAYFIETEVSVDEGMSAGLVLYYDRTAYVAVQVSPRGIEYIQKHPNKTIRPVCVETDQATVRLMIINDRQDVRCYWADAEDHWHAFERSIDVTGYNHNTLGDWHSLRPGLFAAGKGRARFESFRYGIPIMGSTDHLR